MSKTYAVPMIAFVTVGPGQSVEEAIEKLQELASRHGAGQLLQDELIDPAEVIDVTSIHSVANIRNNPLVNAINELTAASAAPWRTLSNEPDAMKYIDRLESASRAASTLVN